MFPFQESGIPLVALKELRSQILVDCGLQAKP